MLDKQYLATDLLTKDKHILRILVIDDEENINLFFKTCLKDQGFHVTFYRTP
jgi:CheY-like chemotaxis protein